MKRMSPERLQVLECLRESGRAMRVGEIARETGRKRVATTFLLQKLFAEGLVESPRYGWYQTRPQTPAARIQVSAVSG